MSIGSLALQPGDLLFGDLLRNLRETEPRLNGVLYAVGMDGLLEIPEVQPAGKKRMSSQEFLRGYARYASMSIACCPASHPLLNKISCT
jgi:hypothetical protein